jgi:hypothetical protein
MKIDVPTEDIGRWLNVLSEIRKVIPASRAGMKDVMAKAKNGITVEIKPLVFRQTDEQRGYYHMWKRAFADFCGNTPDEMHEHLLCEAFGKEIYRTRLGLMQRPLKRSSTAKRPDYSLLIDTLIRVAAEMGFTVPPPIRKVRNDP